MPSQLSLFIDPAPARRDDTSRQAAERLEPKLGRLRRDALAAIKAAGENGMTADEVAAALGVDELTARPRVSELRNKYRLISKSGRKRPSSRGLPSIVWVAQPEE